MWVAVGISAQNLFFHWEHRDWLSSVKRKEGKCSIRFLDMASLGAQPERIYVPMQGHRLDPWVGKMPHAGEQLSLGITRTEAKCCNDWTRCAQGPCSARRELTATSSSAQPWRAAPAPTPREAPTQPNTAISKWKEERCLDLHLSQLVNWYITPV